MTKNIFCKKKEKYIINPVIRISQNNEKILLLKTLIYYSLSLSLTLLLLQGSDSVELFLDNDPLDALDEARDALFIWVQRSPRLRLYTSFSAWLRPYLSILEETEVASDFLLASESCEALIIWPQRLLRLRLYTSFSSSVSPYLDVTVEPEVVFK